MFKNRKAFTMIELIFVIVIMGIIGKFGTEFLAEAYKSFIFTTINNRLQSNSAMAVELISSRLQHRIKDSVIVRNTGVNPLITSDDIWAPLIVSADENASVLEWVGSDIESFRGISDGGLNLPNWSGIIDIDAGNAAKIVSPQTDHTKINALIGILSNSNSSLSDAAINFIGSISLVNGWGWNGAITDQGQSMHPIQAGVNTNEFNSSIAGVNFSGVEVYEYYKIAWTAYAVAHDSATGDLWLYYDYQPWNGENYLDDGKAELIMQNVNSFRFRSVGSLTKIQVCVNSSLVEDYAICKEKTIF